MEGAKHSLAMSSKGSRLRRSRPRPTRLLLSFATIGLFCMTVVPVRAQCDPVVDPDGNTCMDDVTSCNLLNGCTANDVFLAIYNVFGNCVGGLDDGLPCALGNSASCDTGGGTCVSKLISCIEGEEITLNLQAEVIAQASERWDIGMFIALDGGDALTGVCLREFLNDTPLEPGTTGNCTPVCSGSGDPCFKDDDCVGAETCDFGYNPNGGDGPYYDGECSEDPDDLCGDLEQDVPTFFNLPEITITCQDADGNGFLDLGTCTSWNNARSNGGNKPSCIDQNDTLPNTSSKCRCEPVQVGTVIFCDPVDCQDGIFCNGIEECAPDGTCQAGPAVDCDDGVVCTKDACNEATDSCDNVATDANCDNGLFCDGAETCDALLGCQAGTPVDCDDGVLCTKDACNEATDSCDNVATDANCDNGLFCDGDETCDALLGCQAGTAPNCDDGVLCTKDACNEATDSCDNVATDANCDNGLFCDGAETCDALLGCQAGTPPNCDDGVVCTKDACNEATDSCDNVATDANCDNGQFCDGDETCDVLLGCQAGTPVDCDDGVLCTKDACNEAMDSCDNVATDANCDDGDACNGAETCDPVADCTPGTPVVCNPVDKCHTVLCNPATGACDQTLIPDCCVTDGDCGDSATKCRPGLCDLGTNTCFTGPKTPPDCCESDAQCGDFATKCRPGLCDLAINRCFTGPKTPPECCESDLQCGDFATKCKPGLCDLETNTCFTGPKVPDCCESDDQCAGFATKCRPGLCDLVTNTCFTGSSTPPECCENDSECPPDPKCFDSFCDLVTNRCDVSDQFEDCCTDDTQCGKCETCDLATNSCNQDVPGCCTSDAQCGKCETCDLATNTCNKDVPGCCTSDTQCGKCETCDLATNTCNQNVSGCCTSDLECGKCETCDLVTNTCNKDVPGCCTSDAQCGKCETCDLVTNTCNRDVPDCCVSAGECDDGNKCTADDCVDNACVNIRDTGCCVGDGDCTDGEICTTDRCVDNVCVFDPIEPCGGIPTVSQWGLVSLSLLLLAGAKIYFGRRRFKEIA